MTAAEKHAKKERKEREALLAQKMASAMVDNKHRRASKDEGPKPHEEGWFEDGGNLYNTRRSSAFQEEHMNLNRTVQEQAQ